MTNWNTLDEKFLERFFHHNKLVEAKATIRGILPRINKKFK